MVSWFDSLKRAKNRSQADKKQVSCRANDCFFVISPTNSIVMKNNIKCLLGLLLLGGSFSLSSCRHMEMTNDQWREIVQYNYPVDSIDSYHTWNLLQDKALTIRVNIADQDIKTVQVLNGNPYLTEGVEILAERHCRTGQVVNPSFKVPTVAPTLYVAAVNGQGRYYVVPVDNATDVTIGGSKVINDGTLHQPIYQTFTYLFEDDYPLPGDFDFNDVVLRISQHAVNDSTLALQVTLAAVGAANQIGAAIRLPHINRDDVKDVTIEEGSRFDEGYGISRYYISDDELVSGGLDGSAVINLFEDAHWCMKAEESMGQVVRMRYNTMKYEVENEAATVPTVTRTYDIHLKSNINAYYLSLADIDPFIIVASSGLCVEVHTYIHKYDEAIWHYTTGPGDQDDRVPWALMIPDASFHYPVEGIAIGMYRDGQISGAYSRYNHSFGQWGRNRNSYKDWWLYENATKAQVY